MSQENMNNSLFDIQERPVRTNNIQKRPRNAQGMLTFKLQNEKRSSLPSNPEYYEPVEISHISQQQAERDYRKAEIDLGSQRHDAAEY